MIDHHIVTDPTVAEGVPVIQGTQIPVFDVLHRLAAGFTVDAIIEQLPQLEPADIKAALTYAATVMAQPAKLTGNSESSLNSISTAHTPIELDLGKILVVDDLPENRVLIEHMFVGSKYTISMAADAREALAKARTELPALVISDIQMPNASGFDLLKALKANERTRNIAVILVSAHHRNSKEASQGLIMGADDYIYRPFVREEFMSRVEAVMRVKSAEAEIQHHTRMVAQRNKELELVNELALAVTSSLDLQDIFISAMQKLSQLLEIEAVSLLLLNPDERRLVVHISSGTGKRVSAPFSFRYMIESSEQFIEYVPNVVTKVLDNYHADLDLDPISDPSQIQAIPIQSKEQMIGAIAVINLSNMPFDHADWVLLRSAAGIIAVAVENAHLLESAQRQVDDLIALNEVGRALTSSLDLEQTLKQTTLFVQRALQCEAASLWLLDEKAHELVLSTASGIGAELVTGFRLPVGQGVVGYVAQTGESYISGDLSRDERHFTNTPTSDSYSPRSILSTPIQYKGKIIGVIQVLHQQKHWFNYEHLRLSYPVANYVGIAIENARLFREVQDFSRHLERMVAARTQELAEEKEKTEAILASMADGLLVLDADNCILTANGAAERMLDFQLSNWVGKPVELQSWENPLWRCIIDITESDGLMVNVAVDVPVGQSEIFLSIQAHSARVRNEAGQIIGTVIVLRDITALKEVEWMKARFMAGVTHELKTPLSIIRLQSKNLLSYHDRLPPAKRNELLSSIQGQAMLLSQLIEDILELSQLDAGIQKGERESLDLVGLIERLVTDLRPLAEEKQVKLNWQKPPAAVTMMANPSQIERVVRNLIDNAVKYTPDGGSVKVTAALVPAEGRDSAVIWVEDTGVGIPLESQARIFDRFYRLDPSHTVPGTGLGLSIVKEIVNAHDGSIQLESKPGAGSIFTVRLPVRGNSGGNAFDE